MYIVVHAFHDFEMQPRTFLAIAMLGSLVILLFEVNAT